MGKYIGKRILISVLTLISIIFILFILMDLMPGTPFNDERLTPGQIAVLYHKYGLDKPFIVRFAYFLKNLLKGDFGVSYVIAKNMRITSLLSSRFPLTIRIALIAMLIGTLTGIALGILSAVNHHKFLDPVISFISVIGASVPSYVFALAMMYFVSFKLKLLPILFTHKDVVKSTILPAIALALPVMARISRFTRAKMIDVLNSDYITLAEAKGTSRIKVIVKHGIRNALIPLMTIAAPMLVELMFGSTLLERIFSIPGIGSLYIEAIQVNDFNVVISLSFIYSLLYISVMLVVDVLYGVIDPRVRVNAAG